MRCWRDYAKAFSPQIVGLPGSANQLADLARTYRVAYAVKKGPPYEVTHSNAVFFFDRDGKARLVTTDTSRHSGHGGRCEAVAVKPHCHPRASRATEQISQLDWMAGSGPAMEKALDMQRSPIRRQHRFMHHLRQGRMREDGVASSWSVSSPVLAMT